jgi:hypothetical protein
VEKIAGIKEWVYIPLFKLHAKNAENLFLEIIQKLKKVLIIFAVKVVQQYLIIKKLLKEQKLKFAKIAIT